MGEILDFKKFVDKRKEFKINIDRIYSDAERLNFVEFKKNDKGKELLAIKSKGKSIIINTLVKMFVELAKRHPPETWPQSKSEFDKRLTYFSKAVMEQFDGPIPFLIDMMYHKIVTPDGSIDMNEFVRYNPRKES